MGTIFARSFYIIIKNLAQKPPIRDVEPKYSKFVEIHNNSLLHKLPNELGVDINMARKVLNSAFDPEVYKKESANFRDSFQAFMEKVIG